MKVKVVFIEFLELSIQAIITSPITNPILFDSGRWLYYASLRSHLKVQILTMQFDIRDVL